MNRFLKALICSCLIITPYILISSVIYHISAASIYYVTSSGNDTNDCVSPTTTCATINGAIAKAAPGDAILVSAETFTGTGGATVLVDKDISLSGGWDQLFSNRTGRTVVDGQTTRHVLEIADTTNVTIEYFIFQNGYSNLAAGGIWNLGILTIDHCIVENNQGTDSSGGGITSTGTLTIQWSTVQNNSGTAIYNDDYAGPLTILNSTINNNTNGPGVRVTHQNASIVNSTISGNNNGGWYDDGGGIYFGGNGDQTLYLNNVTITGNRATFAGGGIHMVDGYGGHLLMANSIVSGNIANIGSDCYGSITSQGYNIIGDTFNCTFTSTTGDQLDVDPKLGLLQDNGGPTLTHWIYADSTAIDGGNPVGCVDHLGNPIMTDQRGYTRPLDGNSDGNNICDIGVYEADPENLPPPYPGSLWYVTPYGDDANDCLHPATPCNTINGAIGKAISGDTVYVSTGVYSEPVGNEVVLINMSLSISGGWNPEFTEQTDYSTIDGQNTRRGITINDGISVQIDRVYVQYGLSLEGDGGGIYTGYLTKLTINDSVIYANRAGNNDPINPSQRNGGGIGMSTWGRMTINNSLIIGNLASSMGGGIYCGQSTITLNDSFISNNSAGMGGGIAGFNGGQIELNHSMVNNNISGNEGGGIDSFGPHLILSNSTVMENIAGSAGGGISGTSMSIENSSISGNTGSTGGGIYSWYDVEIRNSTILLNTAFDDGGGMYSGGNLTLINTTIAYNKADAPNIDEAKGGGIFRAGGYIQASNVTIARNIAEGSGGGISNQSAPVTLRNSLLAENQAATSPDCSGIILTGGYNLIGNTSSCTFVPAAGDLTNIDPLLAYLYGVPSAITLWADSPAIDGGNPINCADQLGNPITIDQIGTVRPLDGDSDGNFICDIGAFEYDPALPPHWYWIYLPVTNR